VTREQIYNDVRAMMTETFELEPERVTLDARLYEDLDLDSIDALDMVVKLQELIHRRVEERELRALRSVSDVVEMVAGTFARPAE
jgi:acyl carrier protein